MPAEFALPGVEMAHLLVVSEVERSKAFCRHVLGATVCRECGSTSLVPNLQGTWLLVATGGGPTKDRPYLRLEPPSDRKRVSHAMTVRVPDCPEAYDTLQSRSAQSLTRPIDWGTEIRCFFRDPDGHLLEISAVR
jgi:catechol 2,3-dioxygenase-like lactoylglutathione lyase family enzyme